MITSPDLVTSYRGVLVDGHRRIVVGARCFETLVAVVVEVAEVLVEDDRDRVSSDRFQSGPGMPARPERKAVTLGLATSVGNCQLLATRVITRLIADKNRPHPAA